MKDVDKLLLRARASQDQIDAQVLDLMKTLNETPGLPEYTNAQVQELAKQLRSNDTTALLGFLLLLGFNKANEIWLEYLKEINRNSLDNGVG